MHLLPAWWWLQATGVRPLPAGVTALREFFVLALPQPTTPAVPASVLESAPRAARAARTVAPAEVVTPPAASDVVSESASESAGESAGEFSKNPAADPLTAASATLQEGMSSHSDDSTAGRARSAAGAADHALRKGKLAPLAPVDNQWQRFAQAVGNARVDSARTLTSDSHTGADGITIYRFRINGRTWCRTGGDIKPSPFGAQGGGASLADTGGGGGFAGTIACPPGVAFKRD